MYFYNDGIEIPETLGLLDSVTQIVGGVSMGLGIMGGLTLLYFNGLGWLQWFAPMGRMALTNYLMQTFIGVFLFYSIGFNLGGNIGPTFTFPIAVLIIVFQMILSNLWLTHFSYGPMEWIWRKLTYFKLS